MSEEEKKILFIAGNNIDKKKMDTVRKRINRDKDIFHLIRTGKFAYFFNVVIIILGLSLSLKDILFSIIDFDVKFKVSNIINMALILLVSYYTIRSMKDTIQSTMKLPQYIKYIFSKNSPHNPLDIWTTLEGSVADTQIVSGAAKILDKDKLQIIYTGVPYYNIRAIDSITIGWNVSLFEYISERIRYIRYFHTFSIKTIAGNADDKYFKEEEKRLEVSNSVFGILFASGYLKKRYDRIKNNSEGSNRILIKLNEEIRNFDDQFFCKNIIEYCTNNINFTWQPEHARKDHILTVYGIDFLDDKDWYKKNSFFHRMKIGCQNLFSKKIRIPIKRFIAVPSTRNCEQEIDNILLPHMVKSNQLEFGMTLGGAEQNLALLYLVNRNRWMRDKEPYGYIEGRSGLKVGIAENSFDNYNENGFLVGTEGLVYGVTNRLKGRISANEIHNQAEVYYLSIGEFKLFCIYGYSAPMTKMCSMKFLYFYQHEKKDFIPGKVKETKQLLNYEKKLNEKEDFFSSEFLKDWDIKDIINHESELMNWLREINITAR